MKLWTFQPVEIYEQLKKDKVITANPLKGSHYNEETTSSGFVIPGFKNQYTWLEQQYSKRIKNGEPCGHLWWAWTEKHDLRQSRTQYPDGFIYIELEVPDNEVLLTYFDGWVSGPLNGGFVSRSNWEDYYFDYYRAQCPFDIDEDDAELWEKTSKILPPTLESLKEIRDILDGKSVRDAEWDKYLKEWNLYIDEIVEHSWESIFDPEFLKICEKDWIIGDTMEQANFEFLKLDYIKKVKPFKGMR